jgi:hypothetical protein
LGIRQGNTNRPSLESSAALRPTAPSSSVSQRFELLDSRIGTEERLKIFDLELRRLELPAGEEEEPMKVATLDATVDERVVELPDKIKLILGGAADEHADPLASDKIEQTDAIELTAPRLRILQPSCSGASELRRRMRFDGCLIGWRASLLLRLPKRNPSLDCGELTSCMTPQIQKRSEPPAVC